MTSETLSLYSKHLYKHNFSPHDVPIWSNKCILMKRRLKGWICCKESDSVGKILFTQKEILKIHFLIYLLVMFYRRLFELLLRKKPSNSSMLKWKAARSGRLVSKMGRCTMTRGAYGLNARGAMTSLLSRTLASRNKTLPVQSLYLQCGSVSD